MMRFIKILLILPILVYGGLKGYLWYEVKNTMDDVIATAAPFADITYGSVISSLGSMPTSLDSVAASLEGTVGVEDVVIRPKMANDTFTIQEMTVSAPTILDMFFIGRSVKNKELPEYMALEFKKVGIDLNSKTFTMLSNMQAQVAMQQPQNTPLLIERVDALGCGDVVKFGLKEFIDMGYNPLVLDFTMKMNFHKSARKMNLDIRFKDRNFYDVSLDLEFPFNPDKIKSGALSTSKQFFSKMNLKYTDNGYYNLRNRYCAKKNGGTVDQYADANISLLKAQLGAVLPEKTIKSYRNFLVNGGTVNVSMSPAEPATLSGLNLYKNSDVMDMLGLGITINGETVDNDLIIWNKTRSTEDNSKEASDSTEKQEVNLAASTPATSPSSKSSSVLASGSDKAPVSANAKAKASSLASASALAKARAESKAKERAKAKNASKKFDYRTVKKAQLKKYIDRKIKIKISEEKNYEGVLESVAKNQIWIRQRMTGGEFSFPIKLRNIKDIKVYLYM